jgi:hypothetical protein
MESDDPEVIQLELKYCECCGGAMAAVARGAGDLLRSLRSGNPGLESTAPGTQQAARAGKSQN